MNEPSTPGQLLPKEREFLHQTVLDAKPRLVLEVGTWKGGGSTWQIAEALRINGAGTLYTAEPDLACWRQASEGYEGMRFVNCHHGTGHELIRLLIHTNKIPDFVMFDGPEDIDTAIKDFMEIELHVHKGCIFMAHDWLEPSIKAQRLRPYLEASPDWKIERVLSAPESVGLVLAVKK